MYQNERRFGASTVARSRAVVFDEGLRQHMHFFNYMGTGLLIAGLVAFTIGNTPTL